MLAALHLAACSTNDKALNPVPATAVQAPAAPAGQGPRIAITLDDLPWHGAPAPGETRLQATRRLLTALRERGVQATGFVNCGRIDPEEPVLQEWLSAGMELGNHTSRHLDLDRTDTAQWLADVGDCHAILSKLSPRPIRYFRYPMLHQGATEARRQAAATELRRLGYTNAHVTIDNSEWLLANAYQQALKRGDEGARQALSREYVSHLVDGVEHFDRMSREALGRSIPHVLLLHANALAADHLGTLVDALRARGVSIIPLEEALADPVFSAQDVYVGPKGLSWLYRIRPELLRRWGGWDDTQAENIRQRFLPPQ